MSKRRASVVGHHLPRSYQDILSALRRGGRVWAFHRAGLAHVEPDGFGVRVSTLTEMVGCGLLAQTQKLIGTNGDLGDLEWTLVR